MQEFLEEELLKYNLKGLNISVRQNNKTDIYTAGNSMTTQPINPSMVYRIGGQGIPIITTLFLILVDKGYLKVNDKIGDILPKTPNGDHITLAMLCYMTAGLPDVINDPFIANNKDVFKEYTSNELLDIVYHLTPIYPPGERFYFGHITNMLLLGKAMEIRMKKSVKKLLEKYIVKKLHLDNVYYSDQIAPDNLMHSFNNYRIPEYEDSSFWNFSSFSYPGKLLTNANNLSIMFENISAGNLINKKLHKLQVSNSLNDNLSYYGMGLVVNKNSHPTIYWSNANLNGYLGIVAYIKKYNITFTIQTNTDNNDNLSSNIILKDLIDSGLFPCLENVVV
jgi:CubicO group peptidase (beta-lactamase class C family)